MAFLLSNQAPDQESWDVDFSLTDDSIPRLNLTAAYMARFDRKDSTFMHLMASDSPDSNRVIAILYNKMGDTTATMWAQEMYYYDLEERLKAIGDVVVLTPDQRRLATEELIWNEKLHKMHTVGLSHILTTDDDVQGYNLAANEDLTEYTLERISGKVTLEDQ